MSSNLKLTCSPLFRCEGKNFVDRRQRLSSNDRTLDGEEQSHGKEDAEGEQLPSANDVDVSHIKRTQK
jgi:hypothetical protein